MLKNIVITAIFQYYFLLFESNDLLQATRNLKRVWLPSGGILKYRLHQMGNLRVN